MAVKMVLTRTHYGIYTAEWMLIKKICELHEKRECYEIHDIVLENDAINVLKPRFGIEKLRINCWVRHSAAYWSVARTTRYVGIFYMSEWKRIVLPDGSCFDISGTRYWDSWDDAVEDFGSSVSLYQGNVWCGLIVERCTYEIFKC